MQTASGGDVLAANDMMRGELSQQLGAAVAEQQAAAPLGVSLPMEMSAFARPAAATRPATCPEELAYNEAFKVKHKGAHEEVTVGDGLSQAAVSKLRAMAAASGQFAFKLGDEEMPPFIDTMVCRESDGARVDPAMIVAKADASASKAPPRVFHTKHRELLLSIRDHWLKSGRIRAARAPLAVANAFVVELVKDDGSLKLRIVQAHNDSNEKTLGSAFAMPDMSQILGVVSGGTFFMAADAASGYHAMPLAAGCGPNCCITFGDGGVFEPCFLPQGVAIAPQHFGEQLRRVFERTTPAWRVRVYIDDVIGSADDEAACVEMWSWVLEQAKLFNVTLSAKKTRVGMSQIGRSRCSARQFRTTRSTSSARTWTRSLRSSARRRCTSCSRRSGWCSTCSSICRTRSSRCSGWSA